MASGLRLVAIGALVGAAATFGLFHLSSGAAQSPAHPHAAMQPPAAAPVPTLPGQDAFGAVQEIVRILDADHTTDWSRINLAALREHLIDMNEVTLKAAATETPVDGGVRIAVTGSGRMRDAIRRMIPAHARELDGLTGWRAATAPLPDGETLTVTSADPRETARIRGLSFIGLLVTGSHHQPHHLAMARGQPFH